MLLLLKKKLKGTWVNKSVKKIRNIKFLLRQFIARKFGLIYSYELPIFRPMSLGRNSTASRLTVLSANQTLPLLSDFINNKIDKQLFHSIDEIFSLWKAEKNLHGQLELKQLFDQYGSDKGRSQLHLIYAFLLQDKNSITGLLEIGLGTGDHNFVSNMGPSAKPGASVRAFRDFLPKAEIYGADIDKKILFEEKRIHTFFVDQTNSKTFDQLSAKIAEPLDMIIDDGLHLPNANLATLMFALFKLKTGGWFVIEDISKDALSVWHIVKEILAQRSFKSYIIKIQHGYLFLFQNKAYPGHSSDR